MGAGTWRRAVYALVVALALCGSVVAPVSTAQAAQASLTLTIVSPHPLSSGVSNDIYVTAIASTLGSVSGTVELDVNGAPAPGCEALPLSATTILNFEAVCPVTFASPGQYTLSATFSGDSSWFPTSATPVAQTVLLPATSVLTISPSSMPLGTLPTFTATVTGSGPTPTGTVQFLEDSSRPLCSAPLVSGVATCQATAPIGAGTDLMASAAYSGDGTYVSTAFGGTAQPTTFTVESVSTATSVSWSGDPSNGYTFVVHVRATGAGGGIAPSGSVTVSRTGSNPAVLCTAQLSAGSLPASTSCYSNNAYIAGTTIVASYSGDGDYTGSASGSVDITTPIPTPTKTQVVLEGSQLPGHATLTVAEGSNVSYNALITADSGRPTGWVTFTAGGRLLCSTAVSSGSFCSSSTAPVGDVQIVATYYSLGSGFADSTGSTWLHVLAPSMVASPAVAMVGTPTGDGYWTARADGTVDAFGSAGFYGSMAGTTLAQPVVGMASTPTGHGYWLVASDGGIFAFGDAKFYGSTGNLHLNQPVVGMAPTRTGDGYFFVAADGGVFAFGDARFAGSMGGTPLNRPVVGMSLDQATGGYWLVAADGGIFSFGAPFHGSTGNLSLNRPIVGMEASPDGSGYRFVASDGGVFCFGLPFNGSMGGIPLASPVSAMAPYGADGYWLLGGDGGIFSFGAPFFG